MNLVLAKAKLGIKVHDTKFDKELTEILKGD